MALSVIHLTKQPAFPGDGSDDYSSDSDLQDFMVESFAKGAPW